MPLTSLIREKMKKHLFPVTSVLILVLCFSSCKKKDQVITDPYDQLCNPQSMYFFRGLIDQQSKCWNYNLADHTNYCDLLSGTVAEKVNDTVQAYYWDHGIETSVNYGYPEAIIISSKTKYDPKTCTRDQFFSSFQPGIYPIKSFSASDEYPDFKVLYQTRDSVLYVSNIGKQYNSQIQLVYAVDKPDPKNILDSVILCYRVRCTVYNQNNVLDSLRINLAELTVIQERVIQENRRNSR